MRHTEICERGKGADGRGYQIIGDKKERADDGNDFTAMTHAGVDAAAVRIQSADDHIIEPDQRGEHAHSGD